MNKKLISLKESELVNLIQKIVEEKIEEQGSRFSQIQQSFNDQANLTKKTSNTTPEKPKLKYGTYNNAKVVYSEDGLMLTINGKSYNMHCYKYPMMQKPL